MECGVKVDHITINRADSDQNKMGFSFPCVTPKRAPVTFHSDTKTEQMRINKSKYFNQG